MTSGPLPHEVSIADPPAGRHHDGEAAMGRRGPGSSEAWRKGPQQPRGHARQTRGPAKQAGEGAAPVPPFPVGFLPTAMGLVQDFRGMSLEPGVPGVGGCGIPASPYGVMQRPVMMGGHYGVPAPWSSLPGRDSQDGEWGGKEQPEADSPRELASDPGIDSFPQPGGKKFLGNTPRDITPPMSARPAQTSEREICKYFLRTGTCGYGDKCRYYHPRNAQRPRLNSLGYPMRESERPCAFYLKHSWCGFGATCKFHHPELPPNPVMGPAGMVPMNPMAYAMPFHYGSAPGGAYYPNPQQFAGMHATMGGMFPTHMVVPGPMPGPLPGWAEHASQQRNRAHRSGTYSGGAESMRMAQAKVTSGRRGEIAQDAQLQSAGGSSTPNSDVSTSSLVDSLGIPKEGSGSGLTEESCEEDSSAHPPASFDHTGVERFAPSAAKKAEKAGEARNVGK